MYKLGIFILVLSVSLTVLTFPFMLELQNYIGADGLYNYSELTKVLLENLQNFEKTATVTFFASAVGSILISLFCGIFGDYLYRNYTISSIKDIKKEGLDFSESIRKKGGINIFAAVIALFAVEYLPSIICGFII